MKRKDFAVLALFVLVGIATALVYSGYTIFQNSGYPPSPPDVCTGTDQQCASALNSTRLQYVDGLSETLVGCTIFIVIASVSLPLALRSNNVKDM